MIVLYCTRLSSTTHDCPLLHTIVLYCTRLSSTAHDCPLLHTIVLYCTRLSSTAHDCPLLHTIVLYCTRLSSTAHDCLIFSLQAMHLFLVPFGFYYFYGLSTCICFLPSNAVIEYRYTQTEYSFTETATTTRLCLEMVSGFFPPGGYLTVQLYTSPITASC